MKRKRQAIIRTVKSRANPLKNPPPAPWALEPDDLRHQVQWTLATLCEAERSLLRRRLIG